MAAAGLAAAAVMAAAAALASTAWPPGTEIVPFELRDGLVLVRSTLRSPSGRDTIGRLVFDTGAPDLAVTFGVWRAVQLDTVGSMSGGTIAQRRPFDAVELGPLRVPHLAVGGVISDGVLDASFIGLFGPSVLGDRAIVVDYEARKLAVVNRSLTLIEHDRLDVATQVGAVRGAALQRVRRSRARYGAILAAGAAAIPFRLFRGGRILIDARLEDPRSGWHSEPLSLLLDTGASACAVFDDAAAARTARLARWPMLENMPFRTVLGESRMDLSVAPSLALTGGTLPVAQPAVEVGFTARRSLPDIQGELPDPVDGLLGFSFLKHFRVAIDYSDEVLWLSPPSGAERGAERGATTAAGALTRVAIPATGPGLVLDQQWGKLVVGAIVPGSPAAASEARPGDAVISIDGDPVASLAPAEAERRLGQGTGAVAVVVVRRQGMEHVLRLPRSNTRRSTTTP